MPNSFHNSILIGLRAFALAASIYAVATFLLGAASSAQDGLPRNALWEVVHDVCVPGQAAQRNPKPCLKVDLNEGIENGFAILKDPRGVAHFLLVPTVQISGIESRSILSPAATNYFAQAWEARQFLDVALNKSLPRDGIGLAINSAVSRSQDQLHIHIACVYPSVLEELQKNQAQIGHQWAPLNVSIVRRYYEAIWLSGENLAPNNPFRLLAEMPGAAQDMGDYTLVVIGLTRVNGTKGFILLAGRVKRGSGDLANGEELLNQSCSIATPKKKN